MNRGRFSACGTALLVSLLGGCRACDADSAVNPSADARTEGSVPPEPMPNLLGAPIWSSENHARGLGLPKGCRLELPVRHSALPGPGVRFFAATHGADELVMATTVDGSRVEKSGIVNLETRQVVDFPWKKIETPPAADRAASGWVAAWDVARKNQRTAEVWTSGHGTRVALVGDQLSVADLQCDEKCALLTTYARPTIAPGATLLIGAPGAALSDWKRVDIEADPDEPWRPIEVVSIDDSVWVALSSESKLSLWKVGDAAKLVKELDTPHGVLDIVASPRGPVVILPGRPLDECTSNDFPIEVRTLENEKFVSHGQANPDAALARPLDGGAIVAWVSPESCRTRSRSLVHALLLDERGRPSSSVMAVAFAEGFAMATRGTRLDLWLRTESALTWMQADCAPAPRDAGPSE